MREVVGDSSVDEVLTIRRVEVNAEAQGKMQGVLKAYDTGIEIVTVKLQDVNPPEEVKPAFNEVNAAQQDKERYVNKALEEYNKVVPKARGEAELIIRQAEAYAINRVNVAKGDAKRFVSIWEEYKNAKEVTRRRLYLETLVEGLPKVGKIYIIDEVHMLTQEAFNALLKTLEEPPPKVVFVFATTNPTKLPTTILSRCQRFVFKRLSVSEITSRLRTIADKEKIKITENALHYLAIRADGSIRDGESILEQLASFIEGEVTEEDVFKLIGFLGNDFYFTLLNKILTVDLSKVIVMLNKGIEDGADPVEIYRGFTNYLRAAFLIRTGVPCEFVELNSEEIEVLKNIELSRDETIHLLEICLRFEDIVKRSVNVRIAIELLFSQLILCLTKSKKRENNNRVVLSSSPNENVNIKEALFLDLQKNSPKLAGIIHKADITKNNDNVTISVKNEFAKTQLVNNQKEVKSLLKKILNADFILNIEIVHQKEEESNLIQTIKVLFDSEEVR